MSDVELVDALTQLAFLRGMDRPWIEKLAGIGERIAIPAQTVIFREGAQVPYTYLIESGSVALEINLPGAHNRRIQTIGPGELLGWSSVLQEARMTATARSLTPTVMFRVEAARLNTLCRAEPLFGYEFLRRVAVALSRRLSATRLQLLDVYRNELPFGAVAEESRPHG